MSLPMVPRGFELTTSTASCTLRHGFGVVNIFFFPLTEPLWLYDCDQADTHYRSSLHCMLAGLPQLKWDCAGLPLGPWHGSTILLSQNWASQSFIGPILANCDPMSWGFQESASEFVAPFDDGTGKNSYEALNMHYYGDDPCIIASHVTYLFAWILVH